VSSSVHHRENSWIVNSGLVSWRCNVNRLPEMLGIGCEWGTVNPRRSGRIPTMTLTSDGKRFEFETLTHSWILAGACCSKCGISFVAWTRGRKQEKSSFSVTMDGNWKMSGGFGSWLCFVRFISMREIPTLVHEVLGSNWQSSPGRSDFYVRNRQGRLVLTKTANIV
jgi:hypothetical protein